MRGVKLALWLALVSAPALAQGAAPSTGAPADLAKQLRLTATPPEPKDFVRQTRGPAQSQHYVPIDSPRVEPRKPLMSPDEIRRTEADLDSIRNRHDAVSGRKPLAGPFKSTANVAAPQAAGNVGTGCAITCQVNSDLANSVVNSVAPAAPLPGASQ